MVEKSAKQIEKFLKELMDIQRRFANEMKNAKTNRQEEVRELVDKFVASEGSHAD
jgi:4-hydroxy-3-methylbut-2-enyl diphosphate reductase IspH